jgi:hypothetical protein
MNSPQAFLSKAIQAREIIRLSRKINLCFKGKNIHLASVNYNYLSMLLAN